MVAAAVDTFGRLDVIVNNAADMTGEDLEGLVIRMIGKSAGPVEDKEVAPAPLERAVDNPLSSWLNQFATNVHAPYLLMSLAVPYMRSQGGGVIVNMSSGAAEMVDLEWLTSLSKHERRLRNDRVGYATTKAALNRMTNAAAAGLATDNIAVVAVDPGTTRTEVAELLGDRGLLDASDFAPMSDAVETVIDILTSDDPMKFSGQVIRAHADEEVP